MKTSAIRGFVEVAGKHSVSGWCYAPGDTEPVVVKLYVNDIFIRSRRADNEREDVARGGGNLLCGFHFRIGPQLLENLPSDGRAKILVGDQEFELPFLNGKPDHVHGGAGDGGEKLRSMLADKYHIDHWGNLHISFAKEAGKIERLLDFYCEARPLYKSLENLDIYLTGGNLLGLIREFAFLPHDDDVDAAYCISAETPESAADAFFEHFDRIVPKLLVMGYGVLLVNVGQYHIFRKPNKGLDIFIGWITRDGHWYRYVGAGGDFGTNSFLTREIEYLGRKVLVPQYSERELELTYGPHWKERDPHFAWKRSKEVHELMVRFERAGAARVRERQELLRDPRDFIEHFAGPCFENMPVGAT